MRTIRTIPAFAALLLLAGTRLTAVAAPVGGDESSPPIRVGVVESPPFAMKEADGTWSGLAIDLWDRVATELGWRWDPREIRLDEVDGLLRDGGIDAALGAIALSRRGEEEHDYSQPFLATGLGFAEPVKGGASWGSTIAALWSSELFRVVAAIMAATILVGILITLLERRVNPHEFGGPLHSGVAMGVWWAAVTMTTVGYGDTTPKSASGRTLALIWMFVGVVAVAIFTATVTSMLTVGSLRGAVQRPADLLHLRLGAVDGGAGAEFIRERHHGRFQAYPTYEEALAGLAAGKVDAVVANIPALKYLVRAQWQGVLRVAPIVLEPVSYAVGLREGSPLREPLNRALLRVVEEDRWRDVEHQYLGDD